MCDACAIDLKKILKLSLVPLPCQECKLYNQNKMLCESIEWLMDMKGKLPIWSRLVNMNTSGFSRWLPMSMQRKYHIEIKGRLWSMWGNLHRVKSPKCDTHNRRFVFLGVTVMALCAARIICLNSWTPHLLEVILRNGRTYYKESLRNIRYEGRNINLENLNNSCSLDGIKFNLCFTTVYQGVLYNCSLDSSPNLAYALIQFFKSYQFGIVQCFNRYLAIGYMANIEGGYFMFDAQSMNYPLFPLNKYSPYILRTNHLQVLLYCLIISIKSPHHQTPFSIHNVQIDLYNPNEILKKFSESSSSFPSPSSSLSLSPSACKRLMKKETILPKKYFSTPSVNTEYSDSEVERIVKGWQSTKPPPQEPLKYRHPIVPNANVAIVNECKVVPLVDTDLVSKKCVRIEGDFLKIICSETDIPQTIQEVESHKSKSFATDLNELFLK